MGVRISPKALSQCTYVSKEVFSFLVVDQSLKKKEYILEFLTFHLIITFVLSNRTDSNNFLVKTFLCSRGGRRYERTIPFPGIKREKEENICLVETIRRRAVIVLLKRKVL